MAVLYASEFRAVARSFHGWFVLPNIKVHHRDGRLDEDGYRIMRELVYRRMSLDLIEAEALDYLIGMSGGVMRELTTLLQMACNKAEVAGEKQVTRRYAEQAVADIRSEYERSLRQEHYQQLQLVRQDKRIREVHRLRRVEETVEGGLELLELLHNLSILEYRNKEGWWDVHPIVASLL